MKIVDKRIRRSQPPAPLDQIARAVAPICKRHAVLKAMVFGSFATGKVSKRSDLDLMIIVDTDKRFLDRYDGIYLEITDVIEHRCVDLLIYTPAEFHQMQDEPFMRRALKEGVLIYERN